MEIKSNIGHWIELRGYKKVWVAKQIDVSNIVLSRWINGHSMPSVKNLFKLAKILKCKVDDLYEYD